MSDGSGAVCYANPAAARALGQAAGEDLAGRPVDEVIRGFPATVARSRPLPSGHRAWYLSADAVAAQERAAFAIEVSDALAGTLNVRRTLGRIVDLAVPRLGRWATVTLWENDRVRQVSRGPGPLSDDRALPTRRLDDSGRRRLRHALDSEVEHVSVTTPEELIAFGAPPAAAQALLSDGPLQVVTIALRAYGSPVGILAVAAHPGVGAGDGVTALARRAAVALSASRTYEERSHLAATLRSALLPAELPAPPGLQVGSVYRPALEATEIGGDFYEMRNEGPGWSFSLGDVCGKGVEAAVLSGQVRQSLNTVSLVSDDPAERLRLLNAALMSTDGSSFVTLVHGVMRTVGDRLVACLAGGGHPAPLLRRAGAGTVQPVAVRGPIIGMLPEVHFVAAEVDLGPGDTLVCFTDGLPDARGADGLFGVERLAQVLADCEGMTAQAIAERLLQSAFEHLDGRPHDDMAVLTVQPGRSDKP